MPSSIPPVPALRLHYAVRFPFRVSKFVTIKSALLLFFAVNKMIIVRCNVKLLRSNSLRRYYRRKPVNHLAFFKLIH